MKVLAVVVTHNREKLLSRCLDHLVDQKRQPDGVLVVNNGSTDGTENMLANRGIHCITQDNVGSAGGWHRGIQAAIDGNFDAVWLMDDDGYPDHSALEILLKNFRDDISCVSSVVIQEGTSERFVFPFPVLDGSGMPVIFSLKRKIPLLSDLKKISPQGCYDFAHFFNGALINISAVRSIGNVNRDYFIFGDEVDYFFRLKAWGRVLSVLDAFHFHPDVSARPYSSLKSYYYIKNTLIIHRRYFNLPFLRNILAVVVLLFRVRARNGFAEVFSLLLGKNSGLFYRSVIRGLTGKIGKDHDQ